MLTSFSKKKSEQPIGRKFVTPLNFPCNVERKENPTSTIYIMGHCEGLMNADLLEMGTQRTAVLRVGNSHELPITSTIVTSGHKRQSCGEVQTICRNHLFNIRRKA